MNKLITYLRYLYEYLKFGDFISVVASARYVFSRKSHKSDRIISTSMGTFFCRKNTNDFQFANLAYEWNVKKYILDHRTEFSVFIDGGACTGEYCILLSKMKIRCFAFEPVKENFDVLTKNLELNKLSSQIKSLPFGLGDKNKRVNFVFNPVNTGASHIASLKGAGDFLAEIRTFDTVLPDLGINTDDRILFKLDVEGMETEALRGAADFILDYPNITFVIEDKHSGKDSIKEILSSMALFEFGTVDEYNIFAKKINVN
jgi:FkbM family methyltransferase